MDVLLLVAVLDMVEAEGFKNLSLFFVGEEGVTDSPICLSGILTGCTENEYSSPNIRWGLPREVTW